MADFLQLNDETAVRVSDISSVHAEGTISTFATFGGKFTVYTPDEQFTMAELLLLLDAVKEAPGVVVTWDRAWDILDEKMDVLSDDEIIAIYDAMGIELDDGTFKDEDESE